ncbi:MAG: biotin--[acetyl-CoA-carboxylase] ligase [Clostridiales bacterium]|nr:biotin--[acetyl-CoA-carboxylase] ligase [Clostridiales bacterium]
MSNMADMTYNIMKVLRDRAPANVSGEELSRMLGVSRTAVWKHMKQLTAMGYLINAASRNGYSFVSAPEEINGFEIAYNLDAEIIGRNVEYLEAVDSTNEHAKRLAAEGAEDGTVIVSGTQTAGRGRLGRTWESAEGKGIYLSILLKPDVPPRNMQLITVAAAAAAISAIEKTTGLSALVKWPNDIVADGKKLCGILTEMNTELDRVNYMIIGAGINFSQELTDVPEELKDKAISVNPAMYARNAVFNDSIRLELVRSFLIEMDRNYIAVLEGRNGEILDCLRKRSATIGREVRIISRGIEFTGTAVDVTEDAGLVVRLGDGTLKEINSGEVSVRGLLGYC